MGTNTASFTRPITRPSPSQAAALSELEGTALIDDGKGCGQAFVVLRNLAQAWLDDASKHSNLYVLRGIQSDLLKSSAWVGCRKERYYIL